MMPSDFKSELCKLISEPEQHRFLLAVSGGADSMVLASLFEICRLKFEIAHINYKLRGKDSDDDQKLVEDFCEKNNIKLHLYNVSEKDQKPENSIQLWARNLRYSFFNKILKTESLNFLVTAHHLNDNLETFLIHLSRGSGIKGLSGIPANENKILRPLLSFSKDEIYAFAKEHHVDFREDASNKKNDYLRNKIRNTIVPELLKTNDSFLENFSKSIRFLSQTKNFVEENIAKIQNKISFKNGDELIFDKEKLSKESDFVQFEILRKFGFDAENELSKIFEAETGKQFFSADFQLTINRNELIIGKREEGRGKMEEEILLELNGENEIDLSEFIEKDCFAVSTRNDKWRFDAEKLVFPLKLRRKKESDIFFPIGMTGKKKVSKFFKDEKISILAKRKIWLLCNGNDSVLGVVPFRQDRRFSADALTNKILVIKL